MNELICRKLLLSGLALNYTFLGLSAGTEYTISVTAATGAGLGTQTTITATTLQPATPGMVHICTHSLTYSSLLSYITFTIPLTYMLSVQFLSMSQHKPLGHTQSM